MHCFKEPGDDWHEPCGKHQRECQYDNGLIPRNAVVVHDSLDGSIPPAAGSGNRDIKASRRAFRWNREVRATDDYMWECE
jgi:hypothetical protein